MQLTFVTEVDAPGIPEDEAASAIEDKINAIYTHDGIRQVVVQKVYLTRPASLVKIDENTADRLYT
jgi:hypothetical protein